MSNPIKKVQVPVGVSPAVDALVKVLVCYYVVPIRFVVDDDGGAVFKVPDDDDSGVRRWVDPAPGRHHLVLENIDTLESTFVFQVEVIGDVGVTIGNALSSGTSLWPASDENGVLFYSGYVAIGAGVAEIEIMADDMNLAGRSRISKALKLVVHTDAAAPPTGILGGTRIKAPMAGPVNPLQPNKALRFSSD